MVWRNGRDECWHCGSTRHDTGDCAARLRRDRPPAVAQWWACVVEGDESIREIVGPFGSDAGAREAAEELAAHADANGIARGRTFGYTQAAAGALDPKRVTPVCRADHGALHCSRCAE